MPDPAHPAAQRVVRLAMERLGISKPAELARALEMPAYSEGSVSLIRRWLRGEHGPSFDYTMMMLSKAGLLTPEAERAWKGAPSDPAVAARAAAQAAAAALARAAPERRTRRTG